MPLRRGGMAQEASASKRVRRTTHGGNHGDAYCAGAA